MTFEGFMRTPRSSFSHVPRFPQSCPNRPNDVAALFDKHGIAARVIPSRTARDGYSGSMHPWWSERYDETALFTQLALVAGPT